MKNKSDKSMHPILSASKEFVVRFSEVDVMNIVWHGSYLLYFEDARELFGQKYGLKYMDIYHQGYYCPIVDMQIRYKSPLTYGDRGEVRIVYRPSDAAKIIFEYQILNLTNQKVACTGISTQIFMDNQQRLVWNTPEFFMEWKRNQGLK